MIRVNGEDTKIYMKTTTDNLELPVAVAGSAAELARILDTTQNTVKSSISHGYKGWCKVTIEDGIDEEET